MFEACRVLNTAAKTSSIEKKDLILSVLRSTATKREAKNYITRYNRPFLNQPSGWVFESASSYSSKNDVLRAAIVKIRDLKSYHPETIASLGATINRLCQLGLSPLIIIDAGRPRNDYLNTENHPFRHHQKILSWKTSTVVASIETAKGRARPVRSSLDLNGQLSLTSRDLILDPLRQQVVPVVTPIAYDQKTGKELVVNADDAVYSIVKSLIQRKNNGSFPATRVTFDKIIFIEPLGGIPSVERGKNASHVYVNLQQELQEITAELRIGFLSMRDRDFHMDNLLAMDRILSILPVSSSGIITTPNVAALSSSKNPLVYNILTDRPVISPSLPVDLKKTPILETTILRKGVPVKILFSDTGLDLSKENASGRIDLSRLVELINASFRKDLDTNRYLERVNGKIAAVIIAGNYQGAAIVTWETPKSSNVVINFKDLMEQPRPAAGQRIAYLDKFAVQPSEQGGASIADIIFKAMVMRLFRDEIVWRSRRANPVNKWYFERSKGTFKVPDSEWVAFYTGAHTREKTNLCDYVQICQSIEPSFRTGIVKPSNIIEHA